MKTTNISLDEAMKIIHLPPNLRLISIRDEGDDRKLQVSGPNVLSLTFADIRGSQPVLHKGIWYKPMTLKDANKIIDFVNEDPVSDYVVNCTAGISRSAAICMYLCVIYKHQLKENFYLVSDPNPYILGTLISEVYRRIKLLE